MPANTIWTCAGWVHENGDVTFPENCPLPPLLLADSFKIVVQHRNHLGVMSPVQAEEPCGTAVLKWDFRTSNSYQPLFTFGQKQVEPGVWAMYTGNGAQAPVGIGLINSVDYDVWKAFQGTFGYKPGDYTLNSSTNSVDETYWKNNQGRSSGVTFY